MILGKVRQLIGCQRVMLEYRIIFILASCFSIAHPINALTICTYIYMHINLLHVESRPLSGPYTMLQGVFRERVMM